MLGGSILRLHGGVLRADGKQLRRYDVYLRRQPRSDAAVTPVAKLQAAVDTALLRGYFCGVESRRLVPLCDYVSAGHRHGVSRRGLLHERHSLDDAVNASSTSRERSSSAARPF